MSRLAHRRLAIGATAAFLLAMVMGGPVLADTEKGHTGVTGAHSLSDKKASPGATCKYKEVPDYGTYTYFVLKRITVAPPNVKAISGTQRVGWRFAVQRRFAFEHAQTPWYETYKSPIQTATTDSRHNAPFSSKSVNVRGAGNTDGAFSYRVLVSMFWYQANGHVKGTAVHMVDWYKTIEGSTTGKNKGRCWGVQ